MKNCIAAFAIWNVKWVMRYEVQDPRISDFRFFIYRTIFAVSAPLAAILLLVAGFLCQRLL